MQPWVWLVVVWADGTKERAVEDYPPWTYVREIWDGVFVWERPAPLGGEYTVEWVPDHERDARWQELGITLDNF